MSLAPSTPPERPGPLLLGAAVFAGALAIVVVRFSGWLPAVWFGDDLRDYFASVDGLYASSASSSLVTTFAGKWRPIFTFLLWAAHQAFGTELAWYQAMTVALYAAIGVVFFFIAHRLSGSRTIALLLAAVLVWSRFAMYQVTQINGLIEQLPMLLFLLALSLVLAEAERVRRYDDTDRWHARLHLAMLLLGLAAHAHERYLASVIAVGCALLFMPGIARRERIVLALEGAAIMLFNVLMKVWALGIPFFIGAGGRPMDFDLQRTIGQAVDAVLSWLWFNSGPGYLAGTSTIALGAPYVALAGLTCLAAALIAALGVRGALSARAGFWPVALLALCGAALVGPGVVSFRLEQRWLLTSFAMLLLLLAWASRFVRWRDLAVGLAVTIFAGSLVIDNRISIASERQFFVTSSMRLAEAALPLADGRQEPIVFEGLGPDLCSWILTDGQFFRMVRGQARTVYCVGPSWAYPQAPPERGTVRYTYGASGFRPIGG
jgi:hypothetical protein